MKHLLFIAILSYFSISLKAQAKCDSHSITYYKDIVLSKPVKESKAYFKKEVSKIGDTTISRVVRISDNAEMRTSYMAGDKPYGVWKDADSKGKIISEINFDRIKYDSPSLEDTYNNSEDSTDLGFKNAVYPGGDSEVFKFIGLNTKYPFQAKDGGIMGTVFIQCLIKENGDIEPYKILRSAHPYLDAEAWRVMSEMPDWKAATKDGVAINSTYVIPFKFNLR